MTTSRPPNLPLPFSAIEILRSLFEGAIRAYFHDSDASILTGLLETRS
jgi:hypothetical protein